MTGRAPASPALLDAVVLRPMAPEDWPEVAEIYRQGIASGDATFETRVPDWESWDAARSPDCRIVAEAGGAGVAGARANDRTGRELAARRARVVAFAALSPVSNRPVYAGVREVMVYVAERARGRGVGGRLLARVVKETEACGIWTLQAGIFPENAASIRIFERAGFEILGTHRRLGRFHDGRWRDVILMERRSEVAGVD